MLRRVLAGLHTVGAVACLGFSAAPFARGDEPFALVIGAILFGGMAAAMWSCSRWALLPGGLLIVLFTAIGLVFSMALGWPEATVNKAILLCVGFVVLEATSVVITLAAHRKMRQSSQQPTVSA